MCFRCTTTSVFVASSPAAGCVLEVHYDFGLRGILSNGWVCASGALRLRSSWHPLQQLGVCFRCTTTSVFVASSPTAGCVLLVHYDFGLRSILSNGWVCASGALRLRSSWHPLQRLGVCFRCTTTSVFVASSPTAGCVLQVHYDFGLRSILYNGWVCA